MIFCDWLNWQLPIEIFREATYFKVYEIWAGVKKSKLREINLQSLTSASLATMIYNGFIKGKGSPVKDVNDFLPYNEDDSPIDKETILIYLELREKGLIPGMLERIVVDCDLYKHIRKYIK